MNSDIENLIDKIKEIYDKYEERQENKKKEGDFYNVFYVLGLWSDEVKFHSAFLADLLNPNGWHYQKDIFLKEFCSILGFDTLQTNNAEVVIEKNIGKISKDKKHGGRIDIFIVLKDEKGKPFSIIIENKIYAKDQTNQLIRYKNYAEERFNSNYKILYLTLDGKNPEKKSIGFDCDKKTAEYKIFWENISYSTMIKEWLKRCIDKTDNKPNIQRVIIQYFDLLMELTEQGGDTKMNTEIQNLLMTDHNLLYAETLSKEIQGIKQKIIDKNLKNICKKIKPKECSDFVFQMSIDDYYQNFSYELGNSNIKIVFEFRKEFEKDFFYGIPNDKKVATEKKKKIRSLTINDKMRQDNDKDWLWWHYCDDDIEGKEQNLRNWNIEIYDMILNEPQKIKEYLSKTINDIRKALKDNGILS